MRNYDDEIEDRKELEHWCDRAYFAECEIKILREGLDFYAKQKGFFSNCAKDTLRRADNLRKRKDIK